MFKPWFPYAWIAGGGFAVALLGSSLPGRATNVIALGLLLAVALSAGLAGRAAPDARSRRQAVVALLASGLAFLWALAATMA